MNNQEETINQIKDLGVKDPLNPKIEDLKKIFYAFLITAQITKEILLEYIKLIKHSSEQIKNININAQKNITRITEKNLELIDKAIDILGKELNKDLTDSNRKEIYSLIERLIKKAEDKSERHGIKMVLLDEDATDKIFWGTGSILAFGAIIAGGLGYGIYKLSKKDGEWDDNLLQITYSELLDDSY